MAIKTMEFYIKLAKWFERVTNKSYSNHKIANRTIVVDPEWLMRTDGFRALFRRVPDGMVGAHANQVCHEFAVCVCVCVYVCVCVCMLVCVCVCVSG